MVDLSRLLRKRGLNPEETETILEYLSSCGPVEVFGIPVLELLQSGRIVYPYQVYQLLEWLFKYLTAPSDELLDAVRSLAFETSTPRYVKTYCRALLGKFGSNADLERIADTYDETADPSEQVEIICSIKKLEQGRRNALLGRVEKDGEMNSRAVKWVKVAP